MPPALLWRQMTIPVKTNTGRAEASESNATAMHNPTATAAALPRLAFPRLRVSEGGVADSTRGRVRSPF